MKAVIRIAALLCVPCALHAQDKRPCGWDASELLDGMPRSMTALLSRPGASDVSIQAVAQFRRWIDACDEGAARSATLAFRHDVSRHPSNDVAKAMLAMSLARGPEVIVAGGIGVTLRPAHRFSNSEKEALKLFTAVSASNPWPEVGHEAAALGLATRREATLNAAKEIVEHLNKSADGASLATDRGHLALAMNDYAGASSAVLSAASRGNAIALRGLGIAQLMQDSSPLVGGSAYIKGLAEADAAAIALYYDDVRVLLTDAETRQWASIEAPQRSAWLKKAWEWRAATATLTLSERLAVHFKRLLYATNEYTRQSYRGASTFNGIWTLEYTGVEALDDRGIVYVRHGAPDKIVKMAPDPQNKKDMYRMAWLYRGMSGGRAVLEFDKTRDRPDYYLPDPSIGSDCPGAYTAAFLGNGPLGSYYRDILNFLYWNGNGLDQHLRQTGCYGTMAGDAQITGRLSGAQLRRTVANAIYETETATPKLTKPIRSLLNTYAFRGRADTDIWIITSLNASEITGTKTSTGIDYSLKFSTSLENAELHEIVRANPEFATSRTDPFASDEIIQLSSTLRSAPASRVTVRSAVRNQADTLQGEILTTTRSIPKYRAGTFDMSDIVIADPKGGQWTRNGVALSPIAAHRVGAGATFRIYNELYGVTMGDRLTVEITVSHDEAKDIVSKLKNLIDRHEALTLRFDETVDVVTGDMAASTRVVGADLKPGSYALLITVTNVQTGARATRTTGLTVVQ